MINGIKHLDFQVIVHSLRESFLLYTGDTVAFLKPLLSIMDLLWCLVLCASCVDCRRVFCVGSGNVWLSRGFVGSSSGLRPSSRRFRVRSFRMPQSSLPAGTTQFPLLPSLLQWCLRSASGQRSCSRLVRLSFRLFSLSLFLSFGFLQQRPHVSVLAGPF